jgi:hypothetical protein
MNIRNLLVGSAFAVAAVAIPTGAQARTVELDVEIAPPAPRVEVVPAPRHGYTWETGYWRYDHGRYAWQRGHWVVVREGHRYVPHEWVAQNGRWHFRGGHYDDD